MVKSKLWVGTIKIGLGAAALVSEGVQMNPLTWKYIYNNNFFINLITLKNIFAQLGLNRAHLDHKSMSKIKQHKLAHPKTN